MDIVLDCGDLFFGRNVALELEKNLNSLYDAMNGITVTSELPSAALFSSVKSSLKNVIGEDLDDLITRLDNIIRLLRTHFSHQNFGRKNEHKGNTIFLIRK